MVGQTVDDFDRDRGAFGVGSGDDAQVGFGFDGDDLGNGAGVVREVEAVAGSDFDHAAGQAVEQCSAVGSDAAFHEEADAGVEAGEEGVAVAHGVLPEAAFVSVACTVMDRIRTIEC